MASVSSVAIWGNKNQMLVWMPVCSFAALKEKGNDAFRKGDYVVAVQRYTEGLEKLKDKQELYTNRAQVSMRKWATTRLLLVLLCQDTTQKGLFYYLGEFQKR